MLFNPRMTYRNAIISEKLGDVYIPGAIVEVDPDEADGLGAFEENALEEETAWDANADLLGFQNQ